MGEEIKATSRLFNMTTVIHVSNQKAARLEVEIADCMTNNPNPYD